MPRNSAGIYSLPPTNPVTPFTTIATSWANPTMSDIGSELTNSLDRTGRGGMLAPFRIFDGTIGLPGLSFTNETTLGIWRSGPNQMEMVNSGKNILEIYSDRAISPLKLEHRGLSTFKTTGQKSWRLLNSSGAINWNPSLTIDAEDWDTAKGMTLYPDGTLVPTTIVVTPPTAVTGTIAVDCIAGVPTTNHTAFVWKEQSVVRYALAAQGTSSVTWALQVYDAGGANPVNALNVDWSSKNVTIPIGNVTLGTVVRGTGAALDIYKAGVVKSKIQSTDNNATLQFTTAATTTYIGAYTADVNGNVGAVRGPGLVIQQADASGTMNSRLAFSADGHIVVGANSAIVSSYTYLGAFSGSLDFRKSQTYGINPGSTISGFNLMTPGQVGRIFVNGAGAITLPGGSAASLPVSGAVWGNLATIVSILYLDATHCYLSFSPYN